MAQVLGRNVTFTIYNADGTSFHGLVMKKSVSDSIVMSLGDKITGDVYYGSNDLQFTMKEYITYNGINYILVNPPTIVKEGMSSDNSELKGMTKYSLTFYHPMYMLGNFPLRDVAVSNDEKQYLSEKRKFSWIGTPDDFIAKLNKNLQGTQWIVVKSDRFPQDLDDVLSQVLPFDENTIADGLKTMYDEWGVPYIIDQIKSGETYYSEGKRFKVVVGLPSNEIYASATDEQQNNPFVFEYGKGVGLKNNSRTPRNNKIVTRLSGFGSENNIPYGYPQIRWYGDTGRSFTYGDRTGEFTNVTIGGHTFAKIVSYPIYKGILGGAYVELIKHPFTREYLMPSVYRTTLFNKISFLNSDGTPNLNYDPDIELVDYYDAVSDAEHQYPNPINLQAPSFESHGFEDIKPELDPDGDYKLIAVTPLNNDLTPASGWVDDIDDDGNFLQSYFQITLPILPFDIYACAAITEEMQINMRSGACIGCTFDVQVDWDDYKKNFYDDQGNFAPNGAQRNLTKYPKSNSGRITLILQKDNNTFGTLMPNIYQQPKGETTSGADDGDAFVILGISLPDTYITDAESRLDEEMKSYMLENNVYYFDYPLKFDEHFLATHTHILSQIKPNTVVRFNYAGQNLELFVKQLTVKYGENVLPQYDITLTDNVEVTLNQIGQVADDVEKLSSLIAILRQSYGRNVWTELNKKLSKVSDDTAQGFIRMIQGLQVGAMFTPDILGEGGVFRMNADGKVELVTDILYTRVKAYFDNVEIRDYQHTSGNRIASQAQGFKCSRVEWYDSNNNVLEQTVANRSSVAYFRCYWRVDDGQKKTDNQFIIGDLAFCQSAEVTNDSLVTNRFWRLVIGRNEGTTTTEDGEAWVDLSNAHNANGTPKMTTITWIGQGGTSQSMQALSFEAGSGIPTTEDDICQLGNVRDNTRQGAIIEYVSSIDSPTYQIYQDIGSDATNPYSLNNKNYIGLGYNTATGRAYMNVYGDMFIGAKPDPQTGVSPTYIEYKQDDGTQYHRPSLKIKANVEFTNPDSELDSFVQEHQNNYDDSWIQPALDAIQEQIDGELDTWYYAGVPTLNNAPANTWTTDQLKNDHVGDLYYDKNTGYAYRFLYDDENDVYYWTQIHDDAISEALRIASEAQDTADGKRRVFICDADHHTPTPPYDKGDLWVNVKYPWATGATYNNEILKCENAKTSGQSFAIGDWSVANGYTEALKNFVDNTYAPFVTNIQGQVDGKAETWRQATNPANSWSTDAEKAKHVGDLWMDTSANGGNKTYIYVDNGASASIRYAWVAQEVPDVVFDKIDGKASIFVSQPSNYKANDLWILSADTTVNGVAYKQGEVLTSSTDSATYVASHWSKKVRYTDDTYAHGFDFLTSNLARLSSTEIAGGLVLSSLIGLRDNSNNIQSGINGIIQSAKKGNGIAAWYGGEQGDLEDQSHYTGVTRWAKSLFRFDGSGYLAGGNITWDKNGIVTIANVYSDVNGTPVPWSGSTLQYINNISTLLPTTVQSGTTYLDPQVSFWNLSLRGNSVATEKWVNDNFITKEFFETLFNAVDANGNKVSANTTTGIASIKAMLGFWTQQYISALGQNAQGGGGGGGGATTLDALNDVAISDPTNGQVLKYNSSTGKWYNGTDSGVTSVAWSAITGKPSTISGYGISDAYISNGTITIGSNSITPITSMSGYATQSWVNTQLGSYLPLAGGTISSSSIGALKIDKTTNQYAVIGFTAKINDTVGTELGYLGFNGVDSPAFRTVSGTYYSLWHSGNVTASMIPDLSGTYLPLTGGTLSGTTTIQSYIYVDRVPYGALSQGTQLTILSARSKNAGTGNYSSNSVISTFGSGETGTTVNNFPVRIGSPSGATWISAGESGKTFSGVNTGICNTENLYLTADGSISIYTGLANDSTDYATKEALNIDTSQNVWIAGAVILNNNKYLRAKDTSGTVRNLIGISSDNAVGICTATAKAGYNTYLSGNNLYLRYGTTPTIGITLNSSGNVGVGTDAPEQKLDVAETTSAWTGRFYGSITEDGTVTSRASAYLAHSSGNGMWLGVSSTTSSNYIAEFRKGITAIGSGGTSVLRINADGNIGIGTTSPSTMLHVNGTTTTNNILPATTRSYTIGSSALMFSRTYTEYLDTNSSYALKFATGGTERMRVTTGGNVYIGQTSGSYKLDVAGVIHSTTGIFSDAYVSALGQNTSSDIRKKDIKENFALGVDEIAAAPIVRYEWKDNRELGRQVGSIAQYWQKVLPESIHEDGDGYLTMQYGVIALLASISAARKIQDHERRIKELEKENERLRTEFEQLRGE